ncbi:DUF4381 domain-containing protein (plasmid) [Pseudoalteromonas sp. T1lg65]|uniref:DUF4381 domain-containing protein n=1 Tax=Pseudoalteromonas sp. T1lg65 TaxID=2077101 RepID=UPI003F7A409F
MQANPLDQLHDVVTPETVSWWPLSYAMWAVIIVTLLSLLLFIRAIIKHRRFTQAKREAVNLSKQQHDQPLALHETLKRLVKHYYGNEVASLSSSSWLTQLTKLSKVSISEQELQSLYSATPNAELANKLSQAIASFKLKERLDV